MHLSMSSPTYPRSGRRGDCWGFANVRTQIPHPWGQLWVTNPLLIIPGITTVWKSTDIRVANAPTWGQPWVTNPHLLPENLLLGMLQIFLGHDLSAHHPWPVGKFSKVPRKCELAPTMNTNHINHYSQMQHHKWSTSSTYTCSNTYSDKRLVAENTELVCW